MVVKSNVMLRTLRKLLPMLVCVPFLLSISRSQAQENAKARQPVARVDGQAIYEQDLETRTQGQLLRLRNQEYEIKRKALETLIDQKLLEAEAQKQGLSIEKLWQGVDSKVADPTDTEILAYYLGQKDRLNQPLGEVKALLRSRLKLAKILEARQDYLKNLRQVSEVAVYLEQPRVKVAYDPQRVRGNPHAPVMIVEFADFQCPFCRREEPVLKALMKKYGAEVSLAYRDFPLRPIHAQAEPAAEAARCAEDQGKFWQYHDLLIGQTAKLDASSLLDYATQADLDKRQFSDCLSAGKVKTAIDEDLRDGEGLGVSGTPAFFINGILLTGAQPMSEFEKVIDHELAAKHKNRGAPMVGAFVPSR